MNHQWLDTVYDDYHAWKGWKSLRNAENDVARAIVELEMAKIRPPARLLEVGYGDGAFLRRARALGYECAGLERDPSMVEKLEAEGIDARAGTPDQFARRKFDLIAAFDVFEHIHIPELIAYLRDLSDLLDEHGRLVARFPNMASPFGLANQYGDATHVTALSAGSFTQLARLAGLEPVRIANGATVLRGNSGIRALLKPLSLLVRKLIEISFGFAYYGSVIPLGPSVVVVLRKKN